MKSGDVARLDGMDVEIGINRVIIFKFPSRSADIEFWKDESGYHVGIVYHNANRYRHFQMGREPKSWKNAVTDIRDVYDKYAPKVEFTNYV